MRLFFCFLCFVLRFFEDEASALSATSHFGYGVQRHSTTGFAGVGGSFIALDVTDSNDYSFDLGLRSLAEGGRSNQREFYRLGAGPILGWSPIQRWRLELSAGWFKETGLTRDGSTVYRSRGHKIALGWERSRELWANSILIYGGNLQVYRGNLQPQQDEGSLSPPVNFILRTNQGLTQAVHIALQVQLD